MFKETAKKYQNDIVLARIGLIEVKNVLDDKTFQPK